MYGTEGQCSQPQAPTYTPFKSTKTGNKEKATMLNIFSRQLFCEHLQ